jgi:hypothetical protein
VKISFYQVLPLVLALGSCGPLLPSSGGEVKGGVDSAEESAPPAPPSAGEALSPAAQLRRMSLDLLGRPPHLEELERVEADPDALFEIREEQLQDPALENRMRDLLAEWYLTRVDSFFAIEPRFYDLEANQEDALDLAIGEEPLRLAARLVADDRPWAELVTSEYTMSNELLEGIWPVERLEEGDWALSRYEDGRPAWGMLATNGFWLRYATSTSNLNRHRGAAISALFLCENYLARPVTPPPCSARAPPRT